MLGKGSDLLGSPMPLGELTFSTGLQGTSIVITFWQRRLSSIHVWKLNGAAFAHFM